MPAWRIFRQFQITLSGQRLWDAMPRFPIHRGGTACQQHARRPMMTAMVLPAGAFLSIEPRRSAGIIRQPCLSIRRNANRKKVRSIDHPADGRRGRCCRRGDGARIGCRPGRSRARSRSERSRARRPRTRALVRLPGGRGRRQIDRLRDGLPELRGAYGQTPPLAERSLRAGPCASDWRRARLDARRGASGDGPRV